MKNTKQQEQVELNFKVFSEKLPEGLTGYPRSMAKRHPKNFLIGYLRKALLNPINWKDTIYQYPHYTHGLLSRSSRTRRRERGKTNPTERFPVGNHPTILIAHPQKSIDPPKKRKRRKSDEAAQIKSDSSAPSLPFPTTPFMRPNLLHSACPRTSNIAQFE